MARNRRSQSAASRFGPAVKAFLLCLLIGGSGVGYVWQKEQIAKLGHTLKVRESKLNSLETQNEMLRKQLANMRSPQFLEMRIKEANLGLALPQPNQILRLTEPVPGAINSVPEPQYAARSEHVTLAP